MCIGAEPRLGLAGATGAAIAKSTMVDCWCRLPGHHATEGFWPGFAVLRQCTKQRAIVNSTHRLVIRPEHTDRSLANHRRREPVTRWPAIVPKSPPQQQRAPARPIMRELE